MLSTLPQQINPIKVKIKEKVKPKLMPENKTLLNLLLMMLLDENQNILASSLRRIIKLKIVPTIRS